MSKKKIGWRKLVGSGVAVASLGLGFWASQAFYTVKEVVDGDTFLTAEDRYVRLDSVNAPELVDCMGAESKAGLEKLVLNKKVFLKTTYVDGHKRLISNVYTLNGNVGEKMLSMGLAYFIDKGTQKETTLKETANKAKEAKIGIYSPKCSQTQNPENPECNIKGNISSTGKFFRSSSCQFYKNVQVQLYLGDKWFCTEREAKISGFAKGNDCP